MNRRFSFLFLASTLTFAGCTGQPQGAPSDFPDATTTTATGGDGSGPTGTGGDAPAQNPENPVDPASDK